MTRSDESARPTRRALCRRPAQLPADRTCARPSAATWLLCGRRSRMRFRCSTSSKTTSWPPSRCHEDERRLILFYESAEGGAGCSGNVDAPDAWRGSPARPWRCATSTRPATTWPRTRRQGRLRSRLLRLSDELRQSARPRAAGPQADPETAAVLAASSVVAGPGAASRAEHLARLQAICDSDLEREWLDFLERTSFACPKAQHLIEVRHPPRLLLHRARRRSTWTAPARLPRHAAKDRENAECLAGMTVYGHPLSL